MRRRYLVAVTLSWFLITAAATALHWWVWILSPGADGSPSIVEGSWPKELSGLFMMIALPGWGVVSKVLYLPASQVIWLTAAAYSIGFGLWAIGGIILVEARAWWLARTPRPAARIDLSRRRLLTDAPIALAGLGGSATLGYSVLAEPWDLSLVSHTVPIRGLPAPLHNLRIIQISDTHLGPRIPGWHIQRAVQMALGARPDLILLTGDYIHNGARYINHAAALFRPLTAAGIPCVGVMGNHDWYGDGPAVRAAMNAVTNNDIKNFEINFARSPKPFIFPSFTFSL